MNRLKLIYLLLLTLAAATSFIHYTHASNDVKTDIDTISGIQKTIFTTSYGNVVVLLPDEIQAGDSISGTIVVNAGKNNKSNDIDKLYKYTVGINNETTLVAQNSVIKFSLPKSSTGGVTYMVLRNEKGNEVSRNYITYQNYVVNFNAASAPSPWEFQTPSLGRSGRFSVIKGPFDGNFGTTSMLVGNSSVTKIAESPRQMVFKNPDNIQGETELLLMERGIEVRRKYQNIQVVKIDESNENQVIAIKNPDPAIKIPDTVTDEDIPASEDMKDKSVTPVINKYNNPAHVSKMPVTVTEKARPISEMKKDEYVTPFINTKNYPAPASKMSDKITKKANSVTETKQGEPVTPLNNTKGGYIEEKELQIATKKKDENTPTQASMIKESKLPEPNDTKVTKIKAAEKAESVNNPKSSPINETDSISSAISPDKTDIQSKAVDELNYTVQIASYKNEKDALELLSKLESKGYDARIIKAQIPNKGLWYRIRIGAFQNKTVANDYGLKLTHEEPLVTSMFVTRAR